MDGCVSIAMHNLVAACTQEDSSRLKEAVSMVTVATECLTSEKGADKTFEFLKSFIKKELSKVSLRSSLSEGDSTHFVPTRTFWTTVDHLLTHSTLRPLHTLHINLLSSLSHSSLPSLRPDAVTQLQGVVYDHMTLQLLPTSDYSSLEDLVSAMARVQLLADCASCCPSHNHSDLKKQTNDIISKGPKIIHERYKKCVLAEMSGDCHMTDGGRVLKSVELLTGTMFLMATITKATMADEAIVIEATLRLFNHCLEHLLQLAKLFPRQLALQTLYIVFHSLLCLQSDYKHLTALLDFNGHCYSEQLAVSLRECRGYLRERVVGYHQQLVANSLLHDNDANNWTGKQPFYDNERCSFTIQMWHYHMVNLKCDLCTLLPAMAESIVMEILSHTLSFIAGRYQLITPSHKRVSVARADIVCTLLTVWELLVDHTPSLAVHRSCDSLLLCLAITLTPLTALVVHLTTPTQQHHQNQTGVAGDWQLFLSANHLLPCAVKTSQRASPQLESAVDEGTSKRHFVSTPSHHADETSWPNLLQVVCEDADTAVRVCGREEEVGVHLATVLAHCYHTPHSLSRLYTRARECTETGQDTSKAQEAVQRPIIDILLTSTLLGVARVRSEAINKGGVVKEVIRELAEEVSTLPTPTLLLIRTMADTDVSSHHSLGRRVAKVLADVLREWLNSLVSRLNQPLTSIIAEYTTLLTRCLSGLSWKQSFDSDYCVFKRFEEIFSVLDSEVGGASSEVGVGSAAEYNMVVEVMMRDASVLESLRLVCDCLTASHNSHHHHSLVTHNTIGGVPMGTIMERADQLKWDDLLSMVCPSRAQVALSVARRWEYQGNNRSLLTEEEVEQIQTMKQLLES